MKTHTLTPTLLLLCGMCSAQADTQQVFATSGGEGSSATRQISWTVGEPFITTEAGGSFTLTQGFQQPWAEIITDLDELEVGSAEVSVFPNPTAHTLHIVYAGDRAEQDHLELMDAQGRIIQRMKLTDATTSVDMSTYGNGNYFLRLLDAKNTVQRTFTVILLH